MGMRGRSHSIAPSRGGGHTPAGGGATLHIRRRRRGRGWAATPPRCLQLGGEARGRGLTPYLVEEAWPNSIFGGGGGAALHIWRRLRERAVQRRAPPNRARYRLPEVGGGGEAPPGSDVPAPPASPRRGAVGPHPAQTSALFGRFTPPAAPGGSSAPARGCGRRESAPGAPASPFPVAPAVTDYRSRRARRAGAVSSERTPGPAWRSRRPRNPVDPHRARERRRRGAVGVEAGRRRQQEEVEEEEERGLATRRGPG